MSADQSARHVPPLSKNDIRMFLIDKAPEDNYLLDDVEYTNEEICSACQFCVDKYNSQPPYVDTYTVATWPYRYEMLIGTSAMLLRMKAINMTRNRLDYTQQDGTAVQDKNKAPEYLALAKDLMAEFTDLITKIKVSKNMEACYGSVRGPYAYIRGV
jgi:hypothetical protein